MRCSWRLVRSSGRSFERDQPLAFVRLLLFLALGERLLLLLLLARLHTVHQFQGVPFLFVGGFL